MAESTGHVVSIWLHPDNDSDLIKVLQDAPSKSGLIKMALRQHINGGNE